MLTRKRETGIDRLLVLIEFLKSARNCGCPMCKQIQHHLHLSPQFSATEIGTREAVISV